MLAVRLPLIPTLLPEHHACWEAMKRDIDSLGSDPAPADAALVSLAAALAFGSRDRWVTAVCAIDELLAQHAGRPHRARTRLRRFVAENADLLVCR